MGALFFAPAKKASLCLLLSYTTTLHNVSPLAAEKNPVAAQRIGQQLIKSIQGLVDRPFIGRDIGLAGVQDWVANNYGVHYLVQDDLLTVLQVWHGREDRSG